MKRDFEFCSICNGDMDIEGRGGTAGYIGVIPFAFCEWCLSGVFDMVKQSLGLEEE
jgi:hypothetical protein